MGEAPHTASYLRQVVRIPDPTEDRVVVFLDGSGVEGQPPKVRAAAIWVKGVGQETESMVDKMVYGAVSHGEVQPWQMWSGR